MDFESMSLAELKAYAKENNIKGVTALRKNELIEKLNHDLNMRQAASTPVTADEPVIEEAQVKEDERKPVTEGMTTIKTLGDVPRPLSSPTSVEKSIANADIAVQKTLGRTIGLYSQRAAEYQQRPMTETPSFTRFGGPEPTNYGRYPSPTGYPQSRYVQDTPSFTRFPQGNNGYPQSRYASDNQGYYNHRPQMNDWNKPMEPQNPYMPSRQPSFTVQHQSPNGYTEPQPVRPVAPQQIQPVVQPQIQPVAPQPVAPQPQPSVPVQPVYNAPEPQNVEKPVADDNDMVTERVLLDTGISKEGVLEIVKNENYGFIRCANFLPGEDDVYVSPSQIRKFNLKTGDLVKGNLREKNAGEKYQGLAFVSSVNGEDPEVALNRPKFEDLTPVFPHERIHFETPKCSPAMRLVDILSPVGKGQRGMIVSQPKAGKTTLLKQIANSITINQPDMKIIILLIDERPEEVTDIKESIVSENVEVIYSTFDEQPENHKRVAEMVMERAKRLVEHGQDVCILLDSITRLARAYNLTVTNSGRTLSGGLDPTALYMPKKFFGAARCMREGGSLTILATALVETGSRMDDVVFEEFKGTGNMELVLDRSLSEKRIFPAIDLPKSGTRREDLLLNQEELEASYLMRNALNGAKSDEAIEIILNYLRSTTNNEELVSLIRTKGIFVKG